MPADHGIVMLEEIFQFRDHLRIPTIPHRHYYIAQKAPPFGALDGAAPLALLKLLRRETGQLA